jgi:hypothetical protein
MKKSSLGFAALVIAGLVGFTLINGQACTPMQALSDANSSLYSSAVFTISPATQSIGTGTSLQLTASGGASPYMYQVIGGDGTVTSTGVFTAPNTITGLSSISTISAQDALGQVATASITITPGINSLPVTYSPNPASPNQAIALFPSGGTPPYTYTVLQGGGQMVGTVYNAPNYSETAEIQVSDMSGMSGLVIIAIGGGTGTVGSTAMTGFSMTPEGTNIPGGNGCSATSQQAGLVTDVASGNYIFGDQAFCASYGAPTVGATVVTNIMVTAQGNHVSGGLPCPTGYQEAGLIGDCSGGYCAGDQQICVATGTYTTGSQVVAQFYITPENAHNIAPVCNAGYVDVGETSDCGQGNCYGLQLFCALY